jgi:hypothetical protein
MVSPQAIRMVLDHCLELRTIMEGGTTDVGAHSSSRYPKEHTTLAP